MKKLSLDGWERHPMCQAHWPFLEGGALFTVLCVSVALCLCVKAFVRNVS